MSINPECIKCQIRKNIINHPNLDENELLDYFFDIFDIYTQNRDKTFSELSADLDEYKRNRFGSKDYSKIKTYFNTLIMNLSSDIERIVEKSEDPLYRAIQMSLVGNYIDYGAFDSIDENKLMSLINESDKQKLEKESYEKLKSELNNAKELIYLLDNCGEIVLDKILIKQIKKYYPNIHICAVVRGANVINDVSMDDAKEIDLFSVCEVIDNGTKYPSTVLNRLPKDRLERLQQADLIISKGQGNAESLEGCGMNIFYLFLCKCEIFGAKYKAKLFQGILHKEGDFEL